MPELNKKPVKTCDGVDPRDVLSRESSRIKRYDLDSKKLDIATMIESLFIDVSKNFRGILSKNKGVVDSMGDKWKKYIKVILAYIDDSTAKSREMKSYFGENLKNFSEPVRDLACAEEKKKKL
jgi:hypothetical protein